MHSAQVLENMLFDAFPQRLVEGSVAPHDCEECSALRELTGITWADVPGPFVLANDGALPLLSHEAYVALLPAWLREGIRNPDSGVASMLTVNLRSIEQPPGFTRRQAHVIIEIARFLTSHNIFGPDDPVNTESIAEIDRVWSSIAAQL